MRRYLQPLLHRELKPHVAVVVLIALLAGEIAGFMIVHSNTYDEPAYIGAGVAYVRTGRLDLDIREHPPLLKYVIGLAVSAVSPSFPLDALSRPSEDSYQFGHHFLYENPVPPPVLLAAARLPSLLLSLGLAGLVFAWSFRWHGPRGGLLSLLVYATEPNLISHSGLATFDLGMTAFLFAAVYFLCRAVEEGREIDALWSGLCAGAAVASKAPAAIFYLWAPAAWAWFRRPSGGGSLRPRAWVMVFLAPLIVIALAYQGRYLPELGPLLAYRFEQTFFLRDSPEAVSFVHGTFKAGGWWGYYPLTFLLKTSIPFLALSAWALASPPWNRRKAWLLFPVLTYFGVCLFASKQQGVRYLLPIFPFLCVAAGGLLPPATSAGRLAARARGAAVAALLLWAGAEVACVYPHTLAYFNEVAGGPGNGHRWLVDADLDWGQAFPSVRDALREEGSPEAVVACFGTADRDYYLGPHQDLLVDRGSIERAFRHLNSRTPARELLVVSATFLHGLWLSDSSVFDWLKNRDPLRQVAYSVFFYDITHDAVSHWNLSRIYFLSRQYAFALHELDRVEAIAGSDPATRSSVDLARKAIEQASSGGSGQ